MIEKIEKLTPEQEAYLPVFREEWLKFGLSTERVDKVRATAAVKALYAAAGEDEPIVMHFDSPMQCIMAINFFRHFKAGADKRDNLGANLWDNLGDNLWDNLWDNLRDNLGDNLWDNLWDNLRDNLGDNLWDNLRDNLRANLWNNLGANLWDNLGDNLWDNLWDNLGDNLRDNLRDNLGDNLRDNLWDNLRDNLWDNLRDNLGDNLWDNLRDNLRGNLWDNLRDNLRANLWNNLGANLRANLWNNLWDNLWDNLRDNLWDNLGDNLRDNLRANLRANLWNNLWDNLGANLWDNLGDNLWDNLWDNLRDNLGDNLWDNLWDDLRDNLGASKIEFVDTWFWGGQDAPWLAFYQFGQHIGVSYDKQAHFDAYIEFAKSCGWMYAYKGVAFVSDRPTVILKDEEARLHNETGAAVAFADGYEMHSWHGTTIPAEWIKDKASITPKVALTWPNIEQRRVAIEIVGWAKILRELNAKEIDVDGDPLIGTLVEVNLPDLDTPARFCRVQCGTGREFAIGVPPTIKTAIEAQAWMVGIPAKDFARPEIRT